MFPYANHVHAFNLQTIGIHQLIHPGYTQGQSLCMFHESLIGCS
uniref:Uncharacterized protein n=1 Tax=Anguilla anguilla TaxID=7936 RepID=A0A0E9VNG4_ANGAN